MIGECVEQCVKRQAVGKANKAETRGNKDQDETLFSPPKPRNEAASAATTARALIRACAFNGLPLGQFSTTLNRSVSVGKHRVSFVKRLNNGTSTYNYYTTAQNVTAVCLSKPHIPTRDGLSHDSRQQCTPLLITWQFSQQKKISWQHPARWLLAPPPVEKETE